jgi:hypothetical protein
LDYQQGGDVSERELPKSWREHPFDTEAAFGHTGAGTVDLTDLEDLPAWEKPAAPSAVEVANRKEPIERGPRLSAFQTMERDAIDDTLAAAGAALEEAELMLEGLTMLRAATHAHRQIVVGLRDATKEIEEMRSVFQRTLDRATDKL